MKDMRLVEFTEALASGNPVPGGGSVAALAGSLAAALAGMVSNLTKDCRELEDVSGKADELRVRLLDLIEEDSSAFAKVMDAYRMPKGTHEEKDLRRNMIQDALKHAADVPMRTAELSYYVMKLSEMVVSFGNRNAVTDGMVSALMARTAVRASLMNVRVNLSSMKDETYRERMNLRADELENDCRSLEDKIIQGTDL